jgi:hypothetical protein
MKDHIPDIYVVDGSITIFCGSPTNEFKNDILYSSLLSQLIANTEGNSPETWFNAYKTLLGKFYWGTKTIDNQRKASTSSSIFSIINLALSNALNSSELQQLAKAFEMIKQLPSHSPVIEAIINKIQPGHLLRLSESKVDPIKASLLTVNALLTIVRNDKSLVTLQVVFQTTNIIDIGILDQPLPTEAIQGNTDTRLLCGHLMENQYSTVRDLVIQKLGSKPKTNLYHVNTEAFPY